MTIPKIAVVGSVNLDIVASGDRLPAPGETVTGATLARYPGGKGANQALAARRLGADVALHACVGRDADAEAALTLLRAGGVNLDACHALEEHATGVALIAVSADGENQIVVAPGANAAFAPELLTPPDAGAVIVQLETPTATIEKAAACHAFFALNVAPARALPAELLARADLVVANESEAAFYGDALFAGDGLAALTYGAQGAALFQNGVEIARASAPSVTAVDTTGCGDTFVAALVVGLMELREPGDALARACAAGGLAATKAGAQTSFPTRAELDAFLDQA